MQMKIFTDLIFFGSPFFEVAQLNWVAKVKVVRVNKILPDPDC